MNSRFYEIAEAHHTLQYPMTLDTVLKLGEKLNVGKRSRVLDLACGKGELLCQWAREFGVLGVGVDSDATFITQARERAQSFDIGPKLNFVEDDPPTYPQDFHEFDVVICMRLAWMGMGLQDALKLMQPATRSRESIFVIGEPLWREPPTDKVADAIGVDADALLDLGQIVTKFDEAGLELLDFTQSGVDDWDRYEGLQWRSVYDWILENPNDADVNALRKWNADNRHLYMSYGRRYIGWGTFVLGKV